MRNFPLPSPTSPPSLVPTPDEALLEIIISSLTYHPTCVDSVTDKRTQRVHGPEMAKENQAYRRSARALAILSNTILSRTLPFTALKSLFQAMSRLSVKVPVFPPGLDKKDREKTTPKLEYSAGAHIHEALVSLLWSPPTATHPFRREAWFNYRLPPLTFHSARLLLSYALTRFTTPRVVQGFIKHMLERFGKGAVASADSLNVHGDADNTLHDWFAHKRRALRTAMFECHRRLHSLIRLSKFPLPSAKSKPLLLEAPKPSESEQGLVSQTIEHGPSDSELIMQMKMVGALQNDVAKQLVYLAFPYLDVLRYPKVSSDSDPEEVEQELRRRQASAEVAKQRSPWVFVAALIMLRGQDNTPLAERVYVLALDAERESVLNGPNDDQQDCNDQQGNPREGWFLPIEAHFAMLNLYAVEQDEYHRRKREGKVGAPWIHGITWIDHYGIQPNKDPGNTWGKAAESSWAIMVHLEKQVRGLEISPERLRETREQVANDLELAIRVPPIPGASIIHVISTTMASNFRAWAAQNTMPTDPKVGRHLREMAEAVDWVLNDCGVPLTDEVEKDVETAWRVVDHVEAHLEGRELSYDEQVF